MVKTRRSNGENGEVEDGNFTLNDVVSVSDEKVNMQQMILFRYCAICTIALLG